MDSEDMMFEYFLKLSISVAIATNQIQRFRQKWCLVKDYSRKFCQNICSDIAIKANFHFSYYKSMEILSCHSNESAWVTAIKMPFFRLML